MRVTIRDVAKYAGVSRGTVDRVLHHRGYVRADVEEKVKKALEELGYHPNAAARALALNRDSYKIALIIPNEAGFFRDEIKRALQKAREECNVLGVEILYTECNANEPREYIIAIEQMQEQGVQGYALCAEDSQLLIHKINELEAMGIPVITLNSDIPKSNRRAFIGEDSYKSGRVGGELISKVISQKEDILIVGGRPAYYGHTNRVTGFQDSIRDHCNWEVNCQVVYTYESYSMTYQQVMEKLSLHPSIRYVYMATNRISAFVDALEELQLPYHLFTVCHDMEPVTVQYLKEGRIDFIIEQNLYRQGHKPLQMLWEYLLYDKLIVPEQTSRICNIVSAESL